ncbi:MAG: hypothetical protein V4578_17890, partial [Pseudomonadota bacterium]
MSLPALPLHLATPATATDNNFVMIAESPIFSVTLYRCATAARARRSIAISQESTIRTRKGTPDMTTSALHTFKSVLAAALGA